MKGPHPSKSHLAAFLAGELEGARAVEVAEHLDSCAPCRQLCLAQDDLHARLVSSEPDVHLPEGLVEQVLEATHRSTQGRQAGRAPVLVMALLAASGLLFMMLGSPGDLLAEGTTWGRGLSIAAGVLPHPFELQAWIAAPGLALVTGLLLAARRQRPGRY